MDEFTIWCTPEQARKALELGTLLQYATIADKKRRCFVNLNKECYALPTAEQMIGWLEEQGFDITISSFSSAIDYEHVGILGIYTGPRSEVTIAAIDAALEYLLTKNKQ